MKREVIDTLREIHRNLGVQIDELEKGLNESNFDTEIIKSLVNALGLTLEKKENRTKGEDTLLRIIRLAKSQASVAYIDSLHELEREYLNDAKPVSPKT